MDEIERAFRESVDDYLAWWCEEEGAPPEKPYSGRVNLRLPPEMHRELAIKAKNLKLSINGFVEKAIADKIAAVR
ncbi:MAG: toxin-antitoxin system HicB family antitoxin [Treponema sp.]|nr:toxin-antitoxin system HicB family antitoxin [Treponema sp.]